MNAYGHTVTRNCEQFEKFRYKFCFVTLAFRNTSVFGKRFEPPDAQVFQGANQCREKTSTLDAYVVPDFSNFVDPTFFVAAVNSLIRQVVTVDAARVQALKIGHVSIEV